MSADAIEAVNRHGVTPRARIHHMSVWGDDPIMMLSAPIPATQRALATGTYEIVPPRIAEKLMTLELLIGGKD